MESSVTVLSDVRQRKSSDRRDFWHNEPVVNPCADLRTTAGKALWQSVLDRYRERSVFDALLSNRQLSTLRTLEAHHFADNRPITGRNDSQHVITGLQFAAVDGREISWNI